MTRSAETGESTASINRRSDDENWPRARMAMEQSGCILHRPRKLDVYVARKPDRDYVPGTSLTIAAIRRHEASGEIIHAGVDTYILNRAVP